MMVSAFFPLVFLGAAVLEVPDRPDVGFSGRRTAEPPSRRAAETAPCVRIDKAGTPVRGEVKVCPGRYRIADRGEIGVLVVVASGTRLDLTGVTIESGDSVPARFSGVGVLSRNIDSVTVRGGRIRGYRYGIRLEGGRGHRVSGIDLSGSRAARLASTPERFHEADWLDIFRPDTFEAYGGGLYLKRTRGALVTGVVARGSQNGIGLFESREAYVADNDVSGNSGWGIHLWKSSRNTILRNKADHNVRCEGETYRRGCDSAALLLRQESDSNLIADNDLTWSGDGFFLSGHRPLLSPSIGNLVIRNDASHAFHNAFEATFSAWNVFIENRADSADYGFWLGYSRGNVVRGNIVTGSRTAGIAIEHGGENELTGNTIIGGPVGLRLFAPREDDEASTDYRISDNVFAKVERGIVLERTTRARLRGNLFDGVEDGLVVDSAGSDAEVSGNVFLSAQRWLIDAVQLDAGNNYWGPRDQDAARQKVRGKVSLTPFRRASDVGY
jgi:parallel beta-helix repeat protein